eukprot:1433227-Prorocentrum_lima.AAC.1
MPIGVPSHKVLLHRTKQLQKLAKRYRRERNLAQVECELFLRAKEDLQEEYSKVKRELLQLKRNLRIQLALLEDLIRPGTSS